MPEPPWYCCQCRRALQPNARKIAIDGIAWFTKNEKKQMIGLFSFPAIMMMTTMQTITTQTTTTQMTTKTTTKATTMTALCSDDHWALNANGTMMRTLLAQVAKHH